MAPDARVRLHLKWLKDAGYQVSPASSLKDVESACDSGKLDMVLMADAVEPKMKKAIGLTVRERFPETPILQMGGANPDIDGNCFVTGDSQEEILRSVTKILRNDDDIRPAAI